MYFLVFLGRQAAVFWGLVAGSETCTGSSSGFQRQVGPNQ